MAWCFLANMFGIHRNTWLSFEKSYLGTLWLGWCLHRWKVSERRWLDEVFQAEDTVFYLYIPSGNEMSKNLKLISYSIIPHLNVFVGNYFINQLSIFVLKPFVLYCKSDKVCWSRSFPRGCKPLQYKLFTVDNIFAMVWLYL